MTTDANEAVTTGPKETVGLVSVSIDLGAGRRGVDMGPSALRIAGVAGAIEALGYDLAEEGTVYASGAELAEVGEGSARYLGEVVEVCSRAGTLVRRSLDDGCLPLIVGGDHSLSIGTVSAVGSHYRDRGDEIGLIWVDAHADMNTPETTLSGNVHGMALATLLGTGHPRLLDVLGPAGGLNPERVSLIGVRDVDREEKERVKASGARVFTISEVDERGMAACMNEALERASKGTAGFQLSFDLDAIDPLVAPGVGTPCPGGISFREAHLLCEKAARSGDLLSLELVELNPVLDEANRTALLGVGLLESALGKTIL